MEIQVDTTPLSFEEKSAWIQLVAMVAVLAWYALTAAMQSKPEGRDERDRLTEQRAIRISRHILEGGATLALIILVLGINPLWPTHLLFLALFLEEIVRNAIRIILYRKGF